MQFAPGVIGFMLNPFYFTRKGLYKGIKNYSYLLSGKILDIGCGAKPYKDLFLYQESYTGIDIENPGHDHKNEAIDAFYNGKDIPFENEKFDSILCSEVIEHVFEPLYLLKEANRVLKPNGHLLLTCPFIWNEHEMPYDCARYTIPGITSIMENAGFKIIQSEKTSHFTQSILQMKMLYIFHRFPQNKYIRIVCNLLFIFPLTLLGSIICWLLPQDKSLYLNNIILAQKL